MSTLPKVLTPHHLFWNEPSIMMLRVLEPKLMDDNDRALAHAKANLANFNQFLVDSPVCTYPDRAGDVVGID
jgi:hypothetical protein